MEPNHAWAVGIVLKVATYRVAQLRLQSLEVVRFSEDGRTERARHISAFGRFLDYEDDLVQVLTPEMETNNMRWKTKNTLYYPIDSVESVAQLGREQISPAACHPIYPAPARARR